MGTCARAMSPGRARGIHPHRAAGGRNADRIAGAIGASDSSAPRVCFWLVATQSRPLSARVPLVMRQQLMAAEALRGAPYLQAPRAATPSLERIPLMAAVAAPGCAAGWNPAARRARHTHHQESLLGGFSPPASFRSTGVVFHPLLKRVERVGREAHRGRSPGGRTLPSAARPHNPSDGLRPKCPKRTDQAGFGAFRAFSLRKRLHRQIAMLSRCRTTISRLFESARPGRPRRASACSA